MVQFPISQYSTVIRTPHGLSIHSHFLGDLGRCEMNEIPDGGRNKADACAGGACVSACVECVAVGEVPRIFLPASGH